MVYHKTEKSLILYMNDVKDKGVAFPLVDTVDLFGLTLDDSLNFGKHITKISKKVGKKLDVFCRLKNI